MKGLLALMGSDKNGTMVEQVSRWHHAKVGASRGPTLTNCPTGRMVKQVWGVAPSQDRVLGRAAGLRAVRLGVRAGPQSPQATPRDYPYALIHALGL